MSDAGRYRMLYAYTTIIFTALLARLFLPSWFYGVAATSMTLFSLPVLYTISYYAQGRRKFVRGPIERSDMMQGILLAFATGFLVYISLGGTDILLYTIAFILGLGIYTVSEHVPEVLSAVTDPGHPIVVLAASFLLASLLVIILMTLSPFLPNLFK